MTEGKLNLTLARGNDLAGRYDIVARVEPIGNPQLKGFDLVLPSNQPQGKTVDVEAGLYNVQLLLPSGGVLQQFCEVAADQIVPLTFYEPAAQRTGFNLQLETGRASPSEMLDRAIGARRASAFETRPPPPATPAAETRPAGSGSDSGSLFSLAATAAPRGTVTKSRQTQSSGRDTSRAASRRPAAAAKAAPARKTASSGTRTARRHASRREAPPIILPAR